MKLQLQVPTHMRGERKLNGNTQIKQTENNGNTVNDSRFLQQLQELKARIQ